MGIFYRLVLAVYSSLQIVVHLSPSSSDTSFAAKPQCTSFAVILGLDPRTHD
ncbi:hypothetical protein SAMN05443582_102303 [Phyllobacterium sp. OV277]|nr:hypothetical protein SAMN05443582_102303 [Phyllobacterium sp. OV277]